MLKTLDWGKVRIMRGSIHFFLGALLLVAFCFWQNNSIVITKSEENNAKIPKAFDGFVIAHISDLHNKAFGRQQKTLLEKLRSASPDIIVVTGDLVDSRRYDLDTAMAFIRGAVNIAPVYYVPGNHEARSAEYPKIKNSLSAAGVVILGNTQTKLSIDGEEICLAGLEDPLFSGSGYKTEQRPPAAFHTYLDQWSSDDTFRILLSHRPEIFDLYVEHNVDLVFSGHAHGGQIRLPFVSGLIAPHQGFFPQYTSGCYRQGQTSMFVSRGLGNSLFPIRIGNRPELIIVTLNAQ